MNYLPCWGGNMVFPNIDIFVPNISAVEAYLAIWDYLPFSVRQLALVALGLSIALSIIKVLSNL